MSRLPLFASVIALSLGFLSVLHYKQDLNDQNDNNPSLAVNGAYRDGVYLGKLAAEHGGTFPAPVGRWISPEDRRSFSQGYERAYSQIRASREASTNGFRHAH